MGGNLVYSKNGFNIYEFTNGYVVHNTAKSFEEGHTHIQYYATAEYVIRLYTKRKLPHDTPRYLLISLIRISTDKDYTNKAYALIHAKDNRRNKHISRGSKKGVRGYGKM